MTKNDYAYETVVPNPVYRLKIWGTSDLEWQKALFMPKKEH